MIWPKQIILFFFQIFRPFDGPGGGGGQSSPVPQTSGNKSVTRYEEISNKTRPGLNSYNNEWVECDAIRFFGKKMIDRSH